MRKYLEILKVLYDHRKEGFLRARDIRAITNFNNPTVYKSLTVGYHLKNVVNRKKEKNRHIWRINERGISFLALKGIISQEEAEEAIKELKSSKWILE